MAREIQVEFGATVTPAGSTYAFGNALSVTVTIRNVGDADLTVSEITATGAGYSTSGILELPEVIAASGTLAFSLNRNNGHAGLLTILSNDGDEATSTFTLSGGSAHSRRVRRVPRVGRSFTLTELMVVMAVAALLAAILLPALAGARRAGLAARCDSNLRQIALAAITYRDVYRAVPHLSDMEGFPSVCRHHPGVYSVKQWHDGFAPRVPVSYEEIEGKPCRCGYSDGSVGVE